ncbi:954_t:CDS:2, partial [Racocetra persica]
MYKKNHISVKEIQNKKVKFLPYEYKNYCRILDPIVEKRVLFCKQKAAVRNQLVELSQTIKNEPNKSEIEKTPVTIQEPEDSRNPRN